MICVVLINGTLNEANFSLSSDTTIKLNNQAGNAEVTAMCKHNFRDFYVCILQLIIVIM